MAIVIATANFTILWLMFKVILFVKSNTSKINDILLIDDVNPEVFWYQFFFIS